jgi:hypothetical protein
MIRTIKLGRKMADGSGHPWDVKIGPLWYGIVGKGGKSKSKSWMEVQQRDGSGSDGNEIVGETSKSDGEIDHFIEDWVSRNTYIPFSQATHQKFAYELVVFLTDGVNFRLPHRLTTLGLALEPRGLAQGTSGFAIHDGGIAIARVGCGKLSVESRKFL